MSEPNGIEPNLRYCPEYIRSHPGPYDKCSPPLPPWTDPGERYRRFSVFLDTAGRLQLQDPTFQYWMGLGVIGRPFGKTATGFWGFGAQLESNLRDDFTALARIQTSLNLKANGRDRLTLGALGGLRQLRGQPRPTSDGLKEGLTATLGQAGLEAALEWRLLKNFTLTLPYLSARYTFAGSGRLDSGNETKSLPATWDMILGVRLSLDLFPVGE